MSWYLFKDAPSVQNRGIKVDGYQYITRQHVNLSWGINQRQSSNNQHLSSQNDSPTIPSTMLFHKQKELQTNNNLNVLSETSDDEQELLKLVKGNNGRKNDLEAVNFLNKSQKRGQSLKGIMDRVYGDKEEHKTLNQGIDQQMRYLQNSLLPECRRDSMGTILNHNLSKEVPLSESRVSGKSVLQNKNNSKVQFGNGYNIFRATEEPPRQLYQKLKEMYHYDEEYKKRMQKSMVRLG